jgi:hypothetical protein
LVVVVNFWCVSLHKKWAESNSITLGPISIEFQLIKTSEVRDHVSVSTVTWISEQNTKLYFVIDILHTLLYLLFYYLDVCKEDFKKESQISKNAKLTLGGEGSKWGKGQNVENHFVKSQKKNIKSLKIWKNFLTPWVLSELQKFWFIF